MHPFRKYDVYIFDCDGVLLDSNKIKIDAMKHALEDLNLSEEIVIKCIDYFSGNFGKSRYHHVKFFLANFFDTPMQAEDVSNLENQLLEKYATNVEELYPKAPVIPGVKSLLSSLAGQMFVASGSEQQQLQTVLEMKGISSHFREVLGSPTAKTDIIANIISRYPKGVSAVLIGDSLADYTAAAENGIEFVGITGYSNTPDLLKQLCITKNMLCFDYWRDLEGECGI